MTGKICHERSRDENQCGSVGLLQRARLADQIIQMGRQGHHRRGQIEAAFGQDDARGQQHRRRRTKGMARGEHDSAEQAGRALWARRFCEMHRAG